MLDKQRAGRVEQQLSTCMLRLATRRARSSTLRRGRANCPRPVVRLSHAQNLIIPISSKPVSADLVSTKLHQVSDVDAAWVEGASKFKFFACCLKRVRRFRHHRPLVFCFQFRVQSFYLYLRIFVLYFGGAPTSFAGGSRAFLGRVDV